MIVGFDIDGTITKHPKFFSFLTSALIEKGHKVIIITSRDDKVLTEKDLKECGIVYAELIVADYSTTEDLDQWKAKVCQEKDVEIYFEDDLDVLKLLGNEVVSFIPAYQQSHTKTDFQWFR